MTIIMLTMTMTFVPRAAGAHNVRASTEEHRVEITSYEGMVGCSAVCCL